MSQSVSTYSAPRAVDQSISESGTSRSRGPGTPQALAMWVAEVVVAGGLYRYNSKKALVERRLETTQ